MKPIEFEYNPKYEKIDERRFIAMRKATKEHKCTRCKKTIRIKEKYVQLCEKTEDEFWKTFAYHGQCWRIEVVKYV